MILGTGIDIVQHKRLESWLRKEDLLQRYFQQEEIDYIQSKGLESLASLGARFAAKEAFGKALGCGLEGIVLKDIEVSSQENGRPLLKLHNSALKALKEAGGGKVFLSLSHESDYSLAQVIIEEAVLG